MSCVCTKLVLTLTGVKGGLCKRVTRSLRGCCTTTLGREGSSEVREGLGFGIWLVQISGFAIWSSILIDFGPAERLLAMKAAGSGIA